MADRSSGRAMTRCMHYVHARRERARNGGAARFSVVAVGASAGGPEVFRAFLATLSPRGGMAFILVQGLDPLCAGMAVDLLCSRTRQTVLQAREGTQIEPDHIYIAPPGRLLEVDGRTLLLSDPPKPLAVGMPFDFLLRSMAEKLGKRAVCVILSGTGNDGSAGSKAIKQAGGLVIAQDPAEAAFDGMPAGAIAAGAVDLVLPVAKMQAALASYGGHRYVRGEALGAPLPSDTGRLKIFDFLPGKTSHDVTPRKAKMLQRRIARASVSDVAQQWLLDAYVPASVLVNRKHQGLYYFGPTDLYLRMPAGAASLDVLASAWAGLRPAIRAACARVTAGSSKQPVVFAGWVKRGGLSVAVTVSAHAVKYGDEALIMLGFRDQPVQEPRSDIASDSAAKGPALVRIEQELGATRKELAAAIRDREIAEEAAGATIEEAMSVSEADVPTLFAGRHFPNFIDKPIREGEPLGAIDNAMDQANSMNERSVRNQETIALIATLTPRERQVMDMVIGGKLNKQIAHILGISVRTIENRRAAMMKKLGVTSLSQLIRLTFEATPRRSAVPL
jgi:DNA-binding CsgD family transcriptional regulator